MGANRHSALCTQLFFFHMLCSCQLLIAYDPSRASPNMLQNKQGSTQSNGISSSSSGNGHSIGFSSSTSSSTQPSVPDLEQFAFPSWGYWLSRMVGQGVWPQLGTAFADLGIVGVAQVMQGSS